MIDSNAYELIDRSKAPLIKKAETTDSGSGTLVFRGYQFDPYYAATRSFSYMSIAAGLGLYIDAAIKLSVQENPNNWAMVGLSMAIFTMIGSVSRLAYKGKTTAGEIIEGMVAGLIVGAFIGGWTACGLSDDKWGVGLLSALTGLFHIIIGAAAARCAGGAVGHHSQKNETNLSNPRPN